MNAPGASRRLIVLRPLPAGDSTVAFLRSRGEDAVGCPATEVAALPPADYPLLPNVGLHELRWVVLTSTNAVRFFLARAEGDDSEAVAARNLIEAVRTGAVHFAVAGDATAAAAMEAFRRAPDLSAHAGGQDALAEALLASAALPPTATLLYPSARGAADRLPERLAAAGHRVVVASLYESRPCREGLDRLRVELAALTAAARQAPAWLLHYAPSQVEAVRASHGETARRWRHAAIGTTTAAALATWLGRPADAVAARPNDAALLAAIRDHARPGA